MKQVLEATWWETGEMRLLALLRGSFKTHQSILTLPTLRNKRNGWHPSTSTPGPWRSALKQSAGENSRKEGLNLAAKIQWFQKNFRLTVRLTKNACTSTCPSKLALHRVKNRTSLHVKYAKKRNIAQTGIDSSIEDLPPRNRRLIQVLKRNFDQIYDTAYICQSKRMPLRE